MEQIWKSYYFAYRVHGGILVARSPTWLSFYIASSDMQFDMKEVMNTCICIVSPESLNTTCCCTHIHTPRSVNNSRHAPPGRGADNT